jgi:hypothetical protein
MNPLEAPSDPDASEHRRSSRLPAAVRFARMAGSSIATPGAAPWVTDFLNAAFYSRPRAGRSAADLRLAQGIITTRWARSGPARLGATDVLALNRAYGRLRLQGRGRLDSEALLAGARTLIGAWFPEAWADDARRAHGIAFETEAERRAYRPERRLATAALGPLTPPLRDPSEQHWATYDPVHLGAPAAALDLLLDPARWPDFASGLGRFTALRSTGLLGQTFEIEVVADAAPRLPIFTRGYVTCTELHVAREGGDLAEATARVAAAHRAANGPGVPPILPGGAEPLALIVLTTHDGHFLGRGRSHLLVWRDAAGAWVRDIGAWDPLPGHLALPYAAAGKRAQHQFWGPDQAAESMLMQLALVSAAPAA